MTDAMRGIEQQPFGGLRRMKPQSPESERVIAAQQAMIESQAETIRDLRSMLAGAIEERSREAEERRRLMALLTGPRVPWWRRWFR
jgi:hypothetical protein